MVAGLVPEKLKDEWCDVDFEVACKDANRLCGFLPETEEEREMYCASTPFANTKIDIIPESDWREVYEMKQGVTPRILGVPTKDQDGEGSCTSFNQTIEYEYMFVQKYGRQYWIEFSPQSLYQLCGSGPGSGSSLSCNMEKIRTSGLIPADTPANRERFGDMVLKNVGWSQRSNPRPSGWQEFAKNFRVKEWVRIRTMEEFVTCLLLDRPVSYGRSGHSICGVALVWRNNRWYIMYHNSWGNWGDQGFGYDSLSGRLLGYGCYAPMSIYHPDIEGLPLPPAPQGG